MSSVQVSPDGSRVAVVLINGYGASTAAQDHGERDAVQHDAAPLLLSPVTLPPRANTRSPVLIRESGAAVVRPAGERCVGRVSS